MTLKHSQDTPIGVFTLQGPHVPVDDILAPGLREDVRWVVSTKNFTQLHLFLSDLALDPQQLHV